VSPINFEEFSKYFCDLGKDGSRKKSSEDKLNSWAKKMQLVGKGIIASSKTSLDVIEKLSKMKGLSDFEKGTIFNALQYSFKK